MKKLPMSRIRVIVMQSFGQLISSKSLVTSITTTILIGDTSSSLANDRMMIEVVASANSKCMPTSTSLLHCDIGRS